MQKLRTDRPRVNTNKAEWPKLSAEMFAAEQSLFSCSPGAVGILGGSLSKIALAFVEKQYATEIRQAEKQGLSAVVDVRVQRLFTGMYPSIPGWHCDAVPRDSYHGQPSFDAINPAAFHVAVLLSSEPNGVSNTEFVNQDVAFRLFSVDGKSLYSQLHNEVEKVKPDTIRVKDGEFVKFTPRTVHRAMPTTRRGWRMFFRFSMYHNPPLENGVPKQQQVYLLSESNGW